MINEMDLTRSFDSSSKNIVEDFSFYIYKQLCYCRAGQKKKKNLVLLANVH